MSRDAARAHFADAFARFEAEAGGGAPDWLAPIRRAAIERFAELGLPTRRDEAWKYTNAEALAEADLRPVAPHGARLSDADADAAAIAARLGAAPALVFVDGRCDEALGAPGRLPAGVSVTSLARLIAGDPARARELMDDGAGPSRPFSALNLAFGIDGAVVEIGASLDEPLEIAFLHTREGAGRFASPRNRIAVAPGASAAVALHYASLGDDAGAYLTNSVTRVSVGANARLDLVTVQRESEAGNHLASVDVELRRDGFFRSHLIALGGRLARHEISVALAEPGAGCALDGVFLAGGSQHVDNQTLIEHTSPHTTSRELYKGVCAGRARGVFNGVVRVERGAQKIDAQQSNPNLLLSDRAQINSKPTLEIYADDVKCSHGSTIGRLDPDALFYLCARGIEESDARHMLTRAFAAEIVDAIPTPSLRERVGGWIDEKLASLEDR